MNNTKAESIISPTPTSQAIALARLHGSHLGERHKRNTLEGNHNGFYLYILNFDGVIADTLHHYQQAIHLAALSSGAKVEDISASVLTKAKALDASGIADALDLPEKVRLRFIRHLKTNLRSGLWRCSCFEGIRQLLTTLSSRGYTVIMSRSHSSMIDTILHNHGLRAAVHRVIGAEQIGTPDEKLASLFRQYNVNPENAIYCGDSTDDIEFAHKHGMRSAACTWGWQSQQVTDSNATFIAHRTGQLLAQLVAPAGLEPDVAI